MLTGLMLMIFGLCRKVANVAEIQQCPACSVLPPLVCVTGMPSPLSPPPWLSRMLMLGLPPGYATASKAAAVTGDADVSLTPFKVVLDEDDEEDAGDEVQAAAKPPPAAAAAAEIHVEAAAEPNGIGVKGGGSSSVISGAPIVIDVIDLTDSMEIETSDEPADSHSHDGAAAAKTGDQLSPSGLNLLGEQTGWGHSTGLFNGGQLGLNTQTRGVAGRDVPLTTPSITVDLEEGELPPADQGTTTAAAADGGVAATADGGGNGPQSPLVAGGSMVLDLCRAITDSISGVAPSIDVMVTSSSMALDGGNAIVGVKRRRSDSEDIDVAVVNGSSAVSVPQAVAPSTAATTCPAQTEYLINYPGINAPVPLGADSACWSAVFAKASPLMTNGPLGCGGTIMTQSYHQARQAIRAVATTTAVAVQHVMTEPQAGTVLQATASGGQLQLLGRPAGFAYTAANHQQNSGNILASTPGISQPSSSQPSSMQPGNAELQTANQQQPAYHPSSDAAVPVASSTMQQPSTLQPSNIQQPGMHTALSQSPFEVQHSGLAGVQYTAQMPMRPDILLPPLPPLAPQQQRIPQHQQQYIPPPPPPQLQQQQQYGSPLPPLPSQQQQQQLPPLPMPLQHQQQHVAQYAQQPTAPPIYSIVQATPPPQTWYGNSPPVVHGSNAYGTPLQGTLTTLPSGAPLVYGNYTPSYS